MHEKVGFPENPSQQASGEIHSVVSGDGVREFLMNFIAGTAARYMGHPLLFLSQHPLGQGVLHFSKQAFKMLSSLSHAILLIPTLGNFPGDTGYSWMSSGAGKEPCSAAMSLPTLRANSNHQNSIRRRRSTAEVRISSVATRCARP